MIELFQDGGWGMFPTLLFGVLMVAISGYYALRPEKRFVPLMAALAMLTGAAGGLGFVTGVMKSFTAAARFEPRDVAAALALKGTAESLSNIALALLLTVIAALAASLGAWRLARATPLSPSISTA